VPTAGSLTAPSLTPTTTATAAPKLDNDLRRRLLASPATGPESGRGPHPTAHPGRDGLGEAQADDGAAWSVGRSLFRSAAAAEEAVVSIMSRVRGIIGEASGAAHSGESGGAI
jgi:hypothetical protein